MPPLCREVCDRMPKKKPVEEKVEEPVDEEEQVTCPVCGKPVGLTVPSCPFCGAEFEVDATEEVEEAPEAAAPPAAAASSGVSEDEMAECPVCGTMVSLAVSSCPSCGAEFEEEEIEEVVEVEAVEEAPAKAQAKAKPSKVVAEDEEVVVEEEEEPVLELAGVSSGIADLRVIGIALILLGIIGSQIAFMIDWYWTWVPPIEDNLGMFIAVPAVVVVAGLFVFMMIKRSAAEKKKVPGMLPAISMSIFLFGILALILVMLWDPINSALQDSNVGVGGAFVAVLVVGLLAVFMGNRMASPKSA